MRPDVEALLAFVKEYEWYEVSLDGAGKREDRSAASPVTREELAWWLRERCDWYIHRGREVADALLERFDITEKEKSE